MPVRKLWNPPYWVIPSTALLIVVTTVGLLVAFPPKWEWLGVGESQEISQVTTEKIDSQVTTEKIDSQSKTVTTTKHEQAKNLWDWLSLLGVPVSLSILAWWLQQLQQKRAEEQAKEEILQVYFDRISTLLVDKNLLAISTKIENTTEIQPELKDDAISEQEELLNAAIDVIRARTLSILRRLGNDPKRKTSVIQFLFESGVIHRLNLNLSYANLHGINLFDVTLGSFNLSGINLSHANLSNAQLFGVILKNANLTGTNFTGADLTGADLTSDDLNGEKLMGAIFSGANLEDANLSNTYFLGADFRNADLSGANLENADFEYAQFSGVKLNQAQLKGADFRTAKELKLRQIKRAKDLREAKYDPDLQKQIDLLKSETPPDDSDSCPF